MSRATFQYLLHLLRADLEGDLNNPGHTTIPAATQLYIALYYLGSPDSYRYIQLVYIQILK